MNRFTPILTFAAALIFCVPALANTIKLQTPPSPPAVTYDVWGYCWDGRQYVKQPSHSLTTPNLQQAVDYAAELSRFAGWKARTNLPDALVMHTRHHASGMTRPQSIAYPTKPSYSVWAFKRVGEQWTKDEAYCWSTPDPILGLEYAKKVNAVAGWMATTNCPAPIAQFGPIGIPQKHRVMTIQIGGMLIRVPYDRVENGSSTDTAPVVDNTPSYDNSADIQSFNNTQDMINRQNMINNIQQQNNIQDMINTQNMVNSMQANP